MTATPRRIDRAVEPPPDSGEGGETMRGRPRGTLATPRTSKTGPSEGTTRSVPRGETFESGSSTRRSRTGDEGGERARPYDRPVWTAPAGSATPHERDGAAAPSHREGEGREVLRPMFQPLSRPRDEDRGGDAGTARRRGGDDRAGDRGGSRGGDVQPRNAAPERSRPQAEPRSMAPPPREAAPREAPAERRGGAKRRGES
jgi:hypothetical protein